MEENRVREFQDPTVVNLLEGLLEEARKGKILDVVGIALCTEQRVMEFRTSKSKEDPYVWIGRLEGLKAYYLHLIDTCENCTLVRHCPAED